MISIKRAALAAVLTALLASSAQAASTQTIEYSANAEPTIYCAAAFICEIRLQSGERITRAWNPQAQGWSPDGGIVNGRPVITLKPETAGLVANFVVLTTKREYDMWLRSYNLNDYTKKNRAPPPFYTQFLFDNEARLRARHQARIVASLPKPSPTSPPLTIAQLMDAACAKMPTDEQYGIDPEPHDVHPYGLPARGGRGVCHTLDTTYIQMPLGGPNPTDVPSLVEDTADGSHIVNYTYDPTSRIYRVDDVATEYALVVNEGKRQARVRIQRQIGGSTAACPIPKGKR
jgi:hypothetical protein